MKHPIQKLINESKDSQLLLEVFEFAKKAYQGRVRFSGQTYLEHAGNTALILAGMNLDQTTIMAGLLHDTVDNLTPDQKTAALKEIAQKFGPDIATIVQRTSELKKIYYPLNIYLKEHKNFPPEKIENLRKMFLAIAKDLRVILIELASVLDGLHHVEKLAPENQQLYATEVLEIFVPIANRLGLGEIKTTMEDMAFAYLDPKAYQWLHQHIKEKYEQRRRYLKKFIPHQKKIFKAEKIPYLEINYRAKSYWSTYKKLLTHDMDFEKIHDLVALRIIVKNVSDCYRVLGILHKYYKPISERIKDYIAKPKPNGYQSLHTTVFLEERRVCEVQIRTLRMHQEAQRGVCAYWSYKENIDLKKSGDNFKWVHKIPEFWSTFTIDFFADQIFTFTPKGDVIALPKGATAVDFAYAVHSDIGNHCESAKIDGKIIPLAQTLNNGDVVEIITNKKRLPSQDWLKFVKTGFAKSHIKKLILQIPAAVFSVPSFIGKKIAEASQNAKRAKEEKKKIKKEQPGQVYLAGQKGIMITVAKCCQPKHGDQANAYLTRYRAAVLHKVSCANLQKLAQKFPEKVIDATWEKS